MLALGQARTGAQRLWASFGPMVAAFEPLDAAHQGQLMVDLVEETQRWNQSGDATLVVPCGYLEAVTFTR